MENGSNSAWTCAMETLTNGYQYLLVKLGQVTAQQLLDSNQAIGDILENTPLSAIEAVVDLTEMKSLPLGALGLGRNSKLFNPKVQLVIMCGALPVVKAVADVVFRITHYERVKFVNSVEEGLTILQQRHPELAQSS